MSSPAPALALEEYRELVSLDTRFIASAPAPAEEHPALMSPGPSGGLPCGDGPAPPGRAADAP